MAQAWRSYRLKVQITSTPSLREEILQLAHSQSGPVQVIPGCIDIRLLEDTEKPGVLIWEETWTSLELLEQRVASDNFRTVLAFMDISTGSPEITVNEVINEHGMDWITSIRQKKNITVQEER